MYALVLEAESKDLKSIVIERGYLTVDIKFDFAIRIVEISHYEYCQMVQMDDG